jgi:hypothetical protein
MTRRKFFRYDGVLLFGFIRKEQKLSRGYHKMTRNILVTGAASGIGAEICRKLASEQTNFLVHTRSNKQGLDKTVRYIEDLGGRAEQKIRLFACQFSANLCSYTAGSARYKYISRHFMISPRQLLFFPDKAKKKNPIITKEFTSGHQTQT